jgi:hypothetical protein
MRITAITVLSAFAAMPAGVLGQTKSCDFVTPAELEAAIGAKPPAMRGVALDNGSEMCSGSVGDLNVVIRYFKRADSPYGEEEKAVASMKKEWNKVEVKKIGAATCVARSKPQAFPFVSWCTVSKQRAIAVIEVNSKTDVVTVERLAPVAEKMLSRFPDAPPHPASHVPVKAIYRCSLDRDAKNEGVSSLQFDIREDDGEGPWFLEGTLSLPPGHKHAGYFRTLSILDTPSKTSGGQIVIKRTTEFIGENPGRWSFTLDPKSLKGIYEFEGWAGSTKFGRPDAAFKAAVNCAARK